jgi:UV DNA damage endonuclease
MNRIGYCCINLSLNKCKSKKDSILVNRGMVKKTFDIKGLDYVSELTLKNLNDLEEIIKWNIENDIFVYRMSSDMFPCLGFYKIIDLPNIELITNRLKKIGDLAKKNDIRLSFHPSHFCIIASENQKVINSAIDELNKHAELMDMMGLEQSHYYPINIHIGTTKPSREEASNKFCLNFHRLSESCKKRLTVENDDSPNQYSVKMLYDWIYSQIKVPLVFDQHHFNYGPQDQTMEEALKLAHSTWNGVKPLTHMSSPKTLEDTSGKNIAHADYIYEEIKTYGLEFDTELECKKKDIALLKYRKDFLMMKS